MPVRSPRVRRPNSAFQAYGGAPRHERTPHVPQSGLIAHQILLRAIASTARFETVFRGKITSAFDTAILNQTLTESMQTVLRHIDNSITDENQYQEDEQKPDALTATTAKSLVEAAAAAGVREFPRTYISVYYGEIDITWKTDRKLVRLIVWARWRVKALSSSRLS